MTLTKPAMFPRAHLAPPSSRVPLRPTRSAPSAGADPADRDRLLSEAGRLQEKARLSALAGDLAAAGPLILQALDCERRAGGLGPQVLQLIKPR